MRDTSSSGTTWRALLTGAALVGAISLISPWAILVVKGSQLAGNALPIIAVLFLFGLAAVVVPLFKLLRSGLAFSRAELITVYVMMLVGAVVVTAGFAGSFLTVISGVIYYATPENRWGELFVPELNPWLSPLDHDAIRWFYEGLPASVPIPWSAWVRPLVAWIPFLLVFYWVLFCVGVLLRGQWVENERLVFPLTRLPLALLEGIDDSGRLVSQVLKSPLLWIGFAIPFVFHSWNALSFYSDLFQRIPLGGAFSLLQGEMNVNYRLNLPVIGLSWLMPLNVSFSIWFFFVLGVLQEWVLTRIGFEVGTLDVWDSGGSPISMLHQQAGAMVVLCVFLLWTARSHLRGFVRAALHGQRLESEPLSPRMAVVGLPVGMVLMVAWLTVTGLSAWVAVLLVLGSLVVFIALSRIVCEAGLPSLQSPMVPQAFITRGFGPEVLELKNMTGLGLSTVWMGETIVNMMNAIMHSLKLTSTENGANRLLPLAILIAVIVGLTGSIWCIMTLAYNHGGVNLQPWWFNAAPKWPFDYMTSVYHSPEPSFAPRAIFTGIGAAVMSILLFMRGRFAWWPLSPIGFPIAKTVTIAHWNWLAIFTACVLKFVVLRYGGVHLFRRLTPIFLGLILGEFLVACMWVFIDGANGVEGNIIFRQ